MGRNEGMEFLLQYSRVVTRLYGRHPVDYQLLHQQLLGAEPSELAGNREKKKVGKYNSVKGGDKSDGHCRAEIPQRGKYLCTEAVPFLDKIKFRFEDVRHVRRFNTVNHQIYRLNEKGIFQF